jgi:rSAM/selenodomain-associated transferase 1
MTAPGSTLIVFARPPQQGRVKTRLAGTLTAAETLPLYTAMLADTLDLARGLSPVFPSQVIYWADAPPENPAAELLSALAGFAIRRQEGKDLGERMYRALQDQLAAGAAASVLIGCDSPNLPREYLVQALEELERADVVLGPSRDGGYYAVGARRAAPEVFTGIDWGTESVLDQTLAAARCSGITTRLLPVWYDLDRPEDLRRLIGDAGAPRVKRVLDSIFAPRA